MHTKQTGMDQTERKWIKRMRLLGMVAAGIALATLLIAIRHEREPCYQDRPISQWMRQTRHADEEYWNPETDPAWQATTHAVKQMGHDAIPFLLKWAQAHQSPLEEKLCYGLNQHLRFQLPTRWEFWNRNMMAISGFTMLGNEAKAAWPTLIRLTYDTDWERRYVALWCLFESRPDEETFLPVLLRLSHDPNPRIQQHASYMVQYLYDRPIDR